MKQLNNMTTARRLFAAAAALLMTLSAPASGDSLVSERHGKVVVVDFWASWCVPCRRSFPWMNAMIEKYADDGLVIVAVNLDKEREAADEFLAEIPANFDIVFDPDATLAEEFGVEAMPNSFVFDRDGELVARHLGFKVKKQDDYEAVIVEALRDAP